MDLWVRAMFFCDVGFVDRPLARYLIRSDTVTGINRAGSLSWMDGLWLVEGLLSYEEIGEGRPELRAVRRRAAGKSIRHARRRAQACAASRVRSVSPPRSRSGPTLRHPRGSRTAAG